MGFDLSDGEENHPPNVHGECNIKDTVQVSSVDSLEEEISLPSSESEGSDETSEETLEDDTSTDSSEWISIESLEDEEDDDINNNNNESCSIQSGSTSYTFCTIEGLSTIYEKGESQCDSQTILTVSTMATTDGRSSLRGSLTDLLSQSKPVFEGMPNASFVGEEIFVVADCHSV